MALKAPSSPFAADGADDGETALQTNRGEFYDGRYRSCPAAPWTRSTRARSWFSSTLVRNWARLRRATLPSLSAASTTAKCSMTTAVCRNDYQYLGHHRHSSRWTRGGVLCSSYCATP